ncbi:unnamed protein product [Closterium sp. Naga37s-1]|nr:unnamed protein product [Closterium sp. Naga37s-1]
MPGNANAAASDGPHVAEPGLTEESTCGWSPRGGAAAMEGGAATGRGGNAPSAAGGAGPTAESVPATAAPAATAPAARHAHQPAAAAGAAPIAAMRAVGPSGLGRMLIRGPVFQQPGRGPF